MNRRTALVPLVAITTLLALQTAPARAAGEGTPGCAELEGESIPKVKISSASPVVAKGSVPAHCKVQGVIETEIHFELLLPADWNERFLMGGGGGFVGSVQNAAMSPLLPGGNALSRGFATVGTDTGHRGPGIDASWALDNEERELNFGYRAVHLTAVTAKRIIERYYGNPIAHSYFFGCSRGGGQAMMESQRYPEDFDGIVAGAPAYDWPGLGAAFLQTQQAIYPKPSDLDTPVLTDASRKLLADSILAACDERDGVEDGVLNDPRACPFDPATLRCKGETADDCLTDAQLRAVESIYGGAKLGDRELYPGFPFGGETDAGGWNTWIVGRADALGPDTPSLHYAFGTQMYKYLVFDDPDWDYSSYDFSTWEKDSLRAASFLNATDPDLSRFRDRGGKLILWNGWSDSAISALGTIRYYEKVEQLDPEVRDYARLFLLPGVLHCSGGPGPDRVDWIGAISRWVEEGEAPDRLLATRGSSGPSRPLCPYPEVAVYDGKGESSDAASFSCRAPAAP